MATPLCLLLLPRTLEQFILRDQAADLLRSPGIMAVEPARIPYGVFGRLPRAVGDGIAVTQAQRLLLRVRPKTIRVVVIFHPLQFPLARALAGARGAESEIWYGRWDRYEAAYDANPRLRARIAELHALAAEHSALTFAASDELVRLEREAGRQAVLVPLAADSFPSLVPRAAVMPSDDGEVVAVSLGHLGWRNDWALLRGSLDAMPELRLLLIGQRHDDEVGEDADYRALLDHDRVEWLGPLDDNAAARAIRRADVGLVPFKVEPFNDAGLPYRILKYARQGRRTVSPELAGARTWERAVTFASGTDAFVAALREHRGTRMAPDLDVRRWALEQTAWRQNAPLWDRLESLGIAAR